MNSSLCLRTSDFMASDVPVGNPLSFLRITRSGKLWLTLLVLMLQKILAEHRVSKLELGVHLYSMWMGVLLKKFIYEAWRREKLAWVLSISSICDWLVP